MFAPGDQRTGRIGQFYTLDHPCTEGGIATGELQPYGCAVNSNVLRYNM